MTSWPRGLFMVSALLGVVWTSASAQVRPPAADPAYFEYANTSIAPPFVNNFINFPTPPGRRYVIEQASVTCTTPSNTDVFTQAQLYVTKVIGSRRDDRFRLACRRAREARAILSWRICLDGHGARDF